MTVVAVLALAVAFSYVGFSDLLEESPPFANVLMRIVLLPVAILLFASPFLLFYKLVKTRIGSVSIGLGLYGGVGSMYVSSFLSTDGQGGLGLPMGMVLGYAILAVGVFIENFVAGYRGGGTRSST